jgi:hypothetical protein
MASNIIKDLVIDVDDVFVAITESLEETLENMNIQGVGDDCNTNFDIEEVKVNYKNGQFIATIALQRTEGKFVSNQDLEDAVISEISNQKISVEVEIQA